MIIDVSARKNKVNLRADRLINPQGDFTLAVNLSDKDKLYASIPVPGRTAVFLDPLPEPSRGEGSIQ